MSPNRTKVLIGCTVCLTLVMLTLMSPRQAAQFPTGKHNDTAYVYQMDGTVTLSLNTANTTLRAKARIGHQEKREAVKVPQATKHLGYLAVLNIPQQLTAATEDLAQLYMFNQKHLKLGAIEPYVLKSHLKTVPPVSEDFRSLPLISTFLDRSVLLSNLQRCFHSDHVDLHLFPDFLINAARQFIVVRFITAKTAILHSNITNCNFSMEDIEHLLNYHLKKVSDRAISKHGVNYTFRGVYSLCVRADEPFSMEGVAHFIRRWMTNTSSGNRKPFFPQFSVVIPEWRRVSRTRVPYFYYDPSYTPLNMTHSCQLRSIAHTPYVTKAATSMFQHLSLCRPFIAVHVRSERISQQELQWHRAGFIDSCIINFSKILRVVMKKHNISLENVVFIHDRSQYGSDSMNSSQRNTSNYIISRIKELGVNNVQYKPQTNSTDINSESALVQFVEKEFLVSADVLITLGYGGFQTSLIRRFQAKNSSGKYWYKLCSDSPRNDYLPLSQL